MNEAASIAVADRNGWPKIVNKFTCSESAGGGGCCCGCCAGAGRSQVHWAIISANRSRVLLIIALQSVAWKRLALRRCAVVVVVGASQTRNSEPANE